MSEPDTTFAPGQLADGSHAHEWRKVYAPNYRQVSEANDYRWECGCGAWRRADKVEAEASVRDAFRILTRLSDDEVDEFALRLIAADQRTPTPFLSRTGVKIENSQTNEEAFGFEPRW